MNRTLRRTTGLFLCLCVMTVVFGCTSAEKKRADDGKFKIVATLFPQYSFAKEIVGDRAEVELLLPPGTDSHAFDPSMSELLKIQDADLFLYTGEKMETWASSFIKAADESMTVVDLSEGIELLSPSDGEAEHHDHDHGHGHEHEHNVDPHIFTSPVNAVHMARTICDALIQLDPSGKEIYIANTETLCALLLSLDKKFRELAAESKGKTLYFGGKFSLLYFVHAEVPRPRKRKRE